MSALEQQNVDQDTDEMPLVQGQSMQWDEPLVTQQQMEEFYPHLEKMLTEIEFLDPDNPRLLPLRLRRLFGRIQLDRMEYHLLRGIFSRVQALTSGKWKKHYLTRRINPMLKQLKEDIKAVFARDPAARNTLEVLTTYPGIHAIMMHRVAHELWQKIVKVLLAYFLHLVVLQQELKFILALKSVNVFIDHGMGVVIGETAEIGDDVTLYHGVTLGGTTWNKGKRHPTLEDGVVVGAGAKF